MKQRARFLSRFPSSRAGAALIEFAFVLPLLLLLLFGGIEVSRYIMISQRVEKAGFTLNNILTQYPLPITQENVTEVLNQYGTIMTPYGNNPNQQVILTSVTKNATDYKIYIDWQASGSGSMNAVTSLVDGYKAGDIQFMANPPPGTVQADFSGNATILGQLKPGVKDQGMKPGESIFIAEVYYQYQPIASGILKSVGLNIGTTTLTRRTFLQPRNASGGGGPPPPGCSGGIAQWGGGCLGNYGQLGDGGSENFPNTALGFSGSETATCHGTVVSFTNPQCAPGSPVNGSCGPADGNTYRFANGVNAAGLCSAGTADPTAVVNPGPWIWQCNGSNGGTTAFCWADDSFGGDQCKPICP